MIYDLSSIKIKDVLEDEKEIFIENICNENSFPKKFFCEK